MNEMTWWQLFVAGIWFGFGFTIGQRLAKGIVSTISLALLALTAKKRK